jgi:hypothetical protein
MEKSRFLVRPEDSHIFELDESNECYRSYTTRDVTYRDGTRPNASTHFTFENLTSTFDFFPIGENEIGKYEEMNRVYHQWMSWSLRSDGHGGVKGGTMEEYLEQLEQ